MNEQDKNREAAKRWDELGSLTETGRPYANSEGQIFLSPKDAEKARKFADDHEQMHHDGRARTMHTIARALGSSHIPLPAKFLSGGQPEPPTEEERRKYRGLFKNEG